MDSVVSAPVAASGDFAADAAGFSAYWRDARQQLARLPAKPKRDAAAHDAAEALKQAARDARFAFLRRHARTLYDRLTDGRRKFVRIERLVYDAAELVPGLVPTTRRGRGRGRAAPGREGRLRDRPGHPVQPVPGRSRVRPASLPRHAAAARGIGRGAGQVPARRQARSRLRQGRAPGQGGRAAAGQQALPQLRGQLDPARDRDRAPTSASSIPQSQVAVLRGDVVPDGKYAGRRVFNAGINLTHLYYGKIPFLWFLVRDLGFVNKMLRGLAKPEVTPDEVSGEFDREALDLGGRDLRHRRRLPDPAGDRLQHRRRATPTSPCRRARKASSRRWPTSGWRASSATASPARRSCTSAASTAIPMSAA